MCIHILSMIVSNYMIFLNWSKYINQLDTSWSHHLNPIYISDGLIGYSTLSSIVSEQIFLGGGINTWKVIKLDDHVLVFIENIIWV